MLYILKQLFASVSVNISGYLPRRSSSVNIHRYPPPLRRIIFKYTSSLDPVLSRSHAVPGLTAVVFAVYASLVMVFGKLLFGFILGNIASTLANAEIRRVQYEENLGAIQVWTLHEPLHTVVENDTADRPTDLFGCLCCLIVLFVSFIRSFVSSCLFWLFCRFVCCLVVLFVSFAYSFVLFDCSVYLFLFRFVCSFLSLYCLLVLLVCSSS